MSIETPRKSGDIPHSYNYGPAPETPVQDFDNTSLQEALDNKLIQTPDHVGSLTEKSEKKKLSLRNKVIAAIAGIGLVAGGAGVATSLANREVPAEPGTAQPGEQPADQGEGVLPPENTGNDAPASTNPEVSEGFDVTQIPESVVYGNLFETLTVEQQAEITRYEEMTLDEFRALPHQEQLTFAQYVRDNNIGILKYRLDQTGNSSYYKNANLETPGGIYANNQINSFLLSQLVTYESEGGLKFDYDTAKKASALILDHAKDPVAANNLDSLISEWNINTPVAYNPGVFVSGASNEAGYFLANITNASGEAAQTTFIITDGTSITGEPFKQSEQILSVGTSDPRYKQDLAAGQ